MALCCLLMDIRAGDPKLRGCQSRAGWSAASLSLVIRVGRRACGDPTWLVVVSLARRCILETSPLRPRTVKRIQAKQLVQLRVIWLSPRKSRECDNPSNERSKSWQTLLKIRFAAWMSHLNPQRANPNTKDRLTISVQPAVRSLLMRTLKSISTKASTNNITIDLLHLMTACSIQ